MRLYFYLLRVTALWLSLLTSAHALEWKSDIILSPTAMDYSAPADSIAPGNIIGAGWSATADVQEVFWCGLFYWCKEGAMEPGNDAIPTGLVVQVDGAEYMVFETGVQGLGFILGVKDFKATNYVPLQKEPTQTYPAEGTEASATQLGWSAKVTFIRTNDELRSGIYHTRTIHAATLTARNNEIKTASIIINPTEFRITATGCTVNTPEVNVNLNDVNVRALPALGSTSPATTFYIELSCDENIALNAVLSDQSDPTNTSTAVSLTADSTASGVGVEFLYNGVGPLALGPASASSNALHQFFIQQVMQKGTLSLPFQARYVRTGDLVPGSANALANITFSYQ